MSKKNTSNRPIEEALEKPKTTKDIDRVCKHLLLEGIENIVEPYQSANDVHNQLKPQRTRLEAYLRTSASLETARIVNIELEITNPAAYSTWTDTIDHSCFHFELFLDAPTHLRTRYLRIAYSEINKLWEIDEEIKRQIGYRTYIGKKGEELFVNEAITRFAAFGLSAFGPSTQEFKEATLVSPRNFNKQKKQSNGNI